MDILARLTSAGPHVSGSGLISSWAKLVLRNGTTTQPSLAGVGSARHLAVAARSRLYPEFAASWPVMPPDPTGLHSRIAIPRGFGDGCPARDAAGDGRVQSVEARGQAIGGRQISLRA